MHRSFLVRKTSLVFVETSLVLVAWAFYVFFCHSFNPMGITYIPAEFSGFPAWLRQRYYLGQPHEQDVAPKPCKRCSQVLTYWVIFAGPPSPYVRDYLCKLCILRELQDSESTLVSVHVNGTHFFKFDVTLWLWLRPFGLPEPHICDAQEQSALMVSSRHRSPNSDDSNTDFAPMSGRRRRLRITSDLSPRYI